MEMLQEEDPTKYEAHFAKYLEAGIEPDKMEDHTHQLQRNVHLYLQQSIPCNCWIAMNNNERLPLVFAFENLQTGHVHGGAREDPRGSNRRTSREEGPKNVCIRYTGH